MRKEELYASLARIQPSEELICSTINKINEQRLGIREKKSMPTFAFAYRLASALCALVLVVGIALSAQPMLSSDSTGDLGRNADGSLLSEGADATPAAYGIDESEMLAGVGRLQYDSWAVAEGNVSAVLFGELSDSERADGAIFKCVAQIDVSCIRDSALSDADEPTGSINATIAFYDAESANGFISLSGEDVAFLLTEQDGEWIIADYIICD